MKTKTVSVVKARTTKELEKEKRELAEAARRVDEELEVAREEEAIKETEKKITALLKSVMKNPDKLPEELKKVVSESYLNYIANIEESRHKLVVESLTAYRKPFREKKSPEDFLKYLDNICPKKSTAVSAKPPSSVLADPTDKEGEDN
jgi:phosphoenolpyruvate-protein kinase (PTS system EI component)